MILHTLEALLQVSGIASLNVVVNPNDRRLQVLLEQQPKWAAVQTWPVGGESRADSVAAGLQCLLNRGAATTDWVLVHDAARCLIEAQWVENLIRHCRSDPVGGLLALPASDTIKQSDDQYRVSAHIERNDKWMAQTPQMFKLGPLAQALEDADAGVTDESGAIEATGMRPLLVYGNRLNFKITYPEDLQLAHWVLQARRNKGHHS